MENVLISILEASGLGIFIYYLFRSLTEKINGLEGVVNAQIKTIEVMDKRIEETEKVGGIYKNLISDLPLDIDNYKTIISKTKDEVILELKNQKEETEQKLQAAKDTIEASGNPQEKINLHLSILKNLLSEPFDISRHGKKEYDLKKISEFNGRLLEASIPKIINAKTLKEFVHEMGFSFVLTEDDSPFKFVFSEERKMPNGELIEAATSSYNVDGGWHIIANNNIWINQMRMDEWRDEFSSIKTII